VSTTFVRRNVRAVLFRHARVGVTTLFGVRPIGTPFTALLCVLMRRNEMLGRHRDPAATYDKLQIAQVDKHTKGLPQDEDRILPVERVPEQHQTADDGEDPERDRDDALAGALGRNPLHYKAHGEHCLCHVANENSPTRGANEYFVQIVADSVSICCFLQ